MPILENVQRETFAQNLVRTGNQTQSYIDAWYNSKTPEVQASRLIRNDKVKKRIKELRQELSNKQLEDTYDVIKTFKLLRDYWIELDNDKLKDAQTAMKANENLARIWWVYEKDNEQQKPENYTILDISNMTEQDKEAYRKKLLSDK